MQKIQVVNMKCCGCENMIIDALKKVGMKDIDVHIQTQTILFEGDKEKAKKILSKMGYPEAGSKEAESVLKKAKSFASCAVGKMKK